MQFGFVSAAAGGGASATPRAVEVGAVAAAEKSRTLEVVPAAKAVADVDALRVKFAAPPLAADIAVSAVALAVLPVRPHPPLAVGVAAPPLSPPLLVKRMRPAAMSAAPKAKLFAKLGA